MSTFRICAGVNISGHLCVTSSKERRPVFHQDTGKKVGEFSTKQFRYKIGNSEVPIKIEEYPYGDGSGKRDYGFDMAANFAEWLVDNGFFFLEHYHRGNNPPETAKINCLRYFHSDLRGDILHPKGILGAVYDDPDERDYCWELDVPDYLDKYGEVGQSLGYDFMKFDPAKLPALKDKASKLLRNIGINEEPQFYVYATFSE